MSRYPYNPSWRVGPGGTVWRRTPDHPEHLTVPRRRGRGVRPDGMPQVGVSTRPLPIIARRRG